MHRQAQRVGPHGLDGSDGSILRPAPFEQDLSRHQAGASRTTLAMNGDPLAAVQQPVHGITLRLPGGSKIRRRRVIVLDRQVKPLQPTLRAQLAERADAVARHFATRHQRQQGRRTGSLQLLDRRRRVDAAGSRARCEDEAGAALVQWQQVGGMSSVHGVGCR